MLTTRPLLTILGIALAAAAPVACGGGGQLAPASPAGAPVEATAKVEATTRAAASTTPSGASTPGSAAAGGSGNAIPACQLMTKDEARAALGIEVKDGEPGAQPAQEVAPNVSLTVSTCRYSGSTGGRSVTIGYERLSGSGTGQMRDQIRRQFDQSCNQKERASGLGDVACWFDTRHTRLTFLKGTTTVTISIFQEITDPDRAEPLKTAAQTAAGRLQ